MNYIFFCVHRFIIRTPARSDADAWAIVFLALTLWIHALTAYFIVTRFLATEMFPSGFLKGVGVAIFVILIALFFWHYAVHGNGARVISSFEKNGNDAKYARVGGTMFIETLLLPLTVSVALVLWTKLKG